MAKVGIIICARYKNCGGGKCLRSMREHVGAFSIYPENENLEIVGYSTCGGCPGGNVEYVPAEMIKNRAEVIHLATGLVIGYPPCPNIRRFKAFIESAYNVPVRSRRNTQTPTAGSPSGKIAGWKSLPGRCLRKPGKSRKRITELPRIGPEVKP